MENRKRPGGDLPTESQAFFQCRRANLGPLKFLPYDYPTLAQVPISLENDSDHLRRERDQYHFLYIDAIQNLNHLHQALNEVASELNVANHKLDELQSELQAVTIHLECNDLFLLLLHRTFS